MGMILFGSILLLFDINVSTLGIDVLSDLIGWVCVSAGMGKLSKHSKWYRVIIISGLVMFLVSLFSLVITCMGKDNFLYSWYANEFSVTLDVAKTFFRSISWGLKMLVITLVFLSFKFIEDRVSDVSQIRRARDLWFTILIIEIVTYILKTFMTNLLPGSVNKAVVGGLLVIAIFLRVWLVLTGFKISRDYKPY